MPVSPLQIVREVARALNRDQAPEEVLRSVVSLLRSHLPIARATLWRRAPSGIQVVAVSSPADAPVSSWSDLVPTGALRVPLIHAGHRLGVLELESEGTGVPLDEETLGVVADVLAPFLDAVLLSEDLASEVATRARELQEQRRLIGLTIDSLPDREVFSHFDDWLAPLLSAGAGDIRGEVKHVTDCTWEPVGTLREYLDVNMAPPRLSYLDPDARARSEGTRFEPELVIGAGATLGPGASLRRAVVWDGERVPAGLHASEGVFAGGSFQRCEPAVEDA